MNDLKIKILDSKQKSDTIAARMSGKSAHIVKNETNNFVDALKTTGDDFFAQF